MKPSEPTAKTLLVAFPQTPLKYLLGQEKNVTSSLLGNELFVLRSVQEGRINKTGIKIFINDDSEDERAGIISVF
jgi:hypothetical protein